MVPHFVAHKAIECGEYMDSSSAEGQCSIEQHVRHTADEGRRSQYTLPCLDGRCKPGVDASG